MNRRVDILGACIVQEDWDGFFKNFSRQEVTQQRVGFYRELLGELQRGIGEIVSVGSTGTLPGHHAMTHLGFWGDLRGGIPIFWKDGHEILGIRPINTPYPFTCITVRSGPGT